MEHYAIIKSTAHACDENILLLAITHSEEEARKIFLNEVKIERIFAIGHGYVFYADTETEFEAGEEGKFCENHVAVYIMKA